LHIPESVSIRALALILEKGGLLRPGEIVSPHRGWKARESLFTIFDSLTQAIQFLMELQKH